MARLRVRNKILEAVGMFMLEKGKVLSKHEYDESVGVFTSRRIHTEWSVSTRKYIIKNIDKEEKKIT